MMAYVHGKKCEIVRFMRDDAGRQMACVKIITKDEVVSPVMVYLDEIIIK